MQVEFDHIPCPCLLLDKDGVVSGVNAAYAQHFGTPALEIHKVRSRAAWQGEAFNGLTLSRLPNGESLVAVDPDVETFLQRDRLVREATTMAKVGGYELDAESDCFRWTDEVFQIFGVELDFVPTLESVLAYFSDDARKIQENLLFRTLDQGGSFDIELPVINRRGRRVWIRTRGRAVSRHGKVIMISGAIQDITSERRVRRKLAEVLERFAFAQSSAAFGVWDYDPDTGSLHWDQAMFPLYDVDPETFRGTFEDWASCVVPEDLKAASDKLEAAISGEHVFDTEFRVRLRSGGTRWIKATAHVTRGDDGRAKRLVGFNYDITPSKQIEEALRASYAQLEETNRKLEELATTSQAANRAKSEFLANMSHEIRTPMNGVVGMASLLLESELSAQQRDAVDIIRKSADALLQLINDLLDFSKVEAGAVDLVATRVDLREAVDDLVEFLAIDAQRKGLRFFYSVDREVPRSILVDAGRLRQILINLVGNAVKYTDRGHVNLAVGCEQGRLVFTVSDSGCGISESELSTLFAPFTRGSNQGAIGGTGLGLAICYRLACLMGGNVRVSSKVGEGSEFQLLLPVEFDDSVEKAPSGLEGYRVAATGGRPEERQALQELLAYMGADLVDSDPEVELVYECSEPRFSGVPRILLLPAGDVASFRDYADRGLKGPVTLPVRGSQLKQVLGRTRGTLKASQSSGDRALIFDCRVLLAEDNEVNQKVAVRMFAKLGVRYVVVPDGRQALEMLEKEAFDLVLMDLQMPELDGYEATERLKADPRYALNKDTPVVALTAHATQEHRDRCFAIGFGDFLTKPLRVGELRRALKNWLPEKVRVVERS